jgi:rhamnosyltransferase
MKPTCSIIIRAYNEEKHIGRLLEGILQQTVQNVQILLVDSGSTDATVPIASRYPVQVVHLRPEEFTFGHSLNLGLAKAQADVAVIASAHVYPVYPDWLEHLLAPFSSSQVALSYGKQRGAETTHFSEHQIFRHWFPDASVARQGHPFCNNANAAIRRSFWEQHPYDESLPALEDLAWARWAFDQGYAISYTAEAEVIHVHQETWSGVFNRYKREGMAFKRIYPQEHFGKADLVRLLTRNAGSDLRAAAQVGRVNAAWKKILRFRWAQFWGTYQGYQQSGPLTWQLKQAFYYPPVQAKAVPSNPRRVQPIQYGKK